MFGFLKKDKKEETVAATVVESTPVAAPKPEEVQPVCEAPAAPEKEVVAPLAVAIDEELGISYCADDRELFVEVLQEYISQGEEYLEKLPVLVAEKNWHEYDIVTHAMKSTSLNIGAEEFSKEAKEHEFAGKESNEAFIMENYDKLIAHFKQVIEAAKNIH